MTITQQAATGAWPYPGVATVHALVAALGLDGQPVQQQAAAVREFMQSPAWEAAPPVLQRDVRRWLGLLYESQAEFSITAQALDLAPEDEDANATAPDEVQSPGLTVPDDPAAVSIFTAHRIDGALHHLAHATERMQAARAAGDDTLRAYHSAKIVHHLQSALDAGHDLAANIRAHYPDEARELDAVAQAVGLAKAVSDNAKAATTSHLTETLLHELAHAYRHAQQMVLDTPPEEWSFNGDHSAKHLAGAAEHAAKLREHLIDNYGPEGRWLTELDRIASGKGDSDDGHDSETQHAKYEKGTVSAQMANDSGPTVLEQLTALQDRNDQRREQLAEIRAMSDLKAISEHVPDAGRSPLAALAALQAEVDQWDERLAMARDLLHPGTISGQIG